MTSLDMGAAPLNVTAQQGKTWEFTLAFPAGTDLSGYNCNWVMAETYGGSAVLSAGTASGITMGGTAGTIAFRIAATATAGVAAAQYVHEFELTEPGGDRPAFITGTWNVTPEAVR